MGRERWPSLAAMVKHMALREAWMPLADAAQLYRVSTDTMYAWAQAGKFAARRVGDELWLSRDELAAALRRPPSSGPHAGRSHT